VIAREEVLVRIGVVAGPEARIAGVSVVSVVVRAAHRVDGHDRIAVYGGGNRADRLAFGHACREGERRDDDEWRPTGRHGTDRRYAWSPAPTRGPIEQPKSAGSAGARIGLKPVAEMPRHRFGAREPSAHAPFDLRRPHLEPEPGDQRVERAALAALEVA